MIRIIMILLSCLLFSSPLWAAGKRDLPQQPVYNPHSKSYFQLYSDNERPGNWYGARDRANVKIYKGVRGHLAVIDSPETHRFVVENFHLNWPDASVWIGLRYWCDPRVLQWEGRRPFSPTDGDQFRLWHAQWSRTGVDVCGGYASGRTGYAPVYYRNIGGIVRWQLVGAGKGFANYLVEFPTGGE